MRSWCDVGAGGSSHQVPREPDAAFGLHDRHDEPSAANVESWTDPWPWGSISPGPSNLVLILKGSPTVFPAAGSNRIAQRLASPPRRETK